MWLGDFPEDFTTVVCMFTTHDSAGAPVAPSSALEAADVLIYKNGNAAQKTSTNGVTMTSPFDSVTGLHCLVIDTSNDTGDAGFWVAGAVYTLVLSPDETVDSVAVAKVIGQFGIECANTLRPNTQGRKVDVDASGGVEVGSFQANAITTAAINDGALTTAKLGSGFFDGVWSVATRLLTAGTNIVLAKGTGVTGFNDLSAAQVNAEADTALADVGLTTTITGRIDAAISSRLASASYTAPPSANDNADALLDRTAGIETNRTLRQGLRIMLAALAGKASGLATATAVYRDTNDSKDRITATVDADGNRSAVTLDAS